MKEIYIIAGFGFTAFILEMILSSNGKAHEAKMVQITAMAACLIIVINLINETLNVSRGVFGGW